jgi:hypothetical protein
MSVYGDFDFRFRPKPAYWRIALTSLGQLLIAAVLAALFLGLADMLVLRNSGLRRAWLIHGAPWQRLAGIERLSGYASIVAEERTRAMPFLAGGALLLAMLIYFWPLAPMLGRRMFAMSLVQMIMLFTVWPIVIAANLYVAAAVLIVAIFFVIRAEGWIANDLANVIELQRPGRRVTLWLIRVVPASAILGALAYRNEYVEGWIAAAAFATLTFFVAIARRPPARYEKLDGVELREAGAATPIVALMFVGAAFFVFGGEPIVIEKRLIVIGPDSGIVSRMDVRARLPEWWQPRAKLRSRATLW